MYGNIIRTYKLHDNDNGRSEEEELSIWAII